MTDPSFSLLANLSKVETADAARSDGKVSFVDAMQQMAISSVFDIIRRSKPAFMRELMTLSDANGELAYENARCYATQIVRLYRNQLVSSGRTQTLTRRTGVRSLVEIGPSFPNLFKENWDLFCKVGALEAKDSPVAYLTSLYRFAINQLEGSTNEANRINLDLRRPDLKAVPAFAIYGLPSPEPGAAIQRGRAVAGIYFRSGPQSQGFGPSLLECTAAGRSVGPGLLHARAH